MSIKALSAISSPTSGSPPASGENPPPEVWKIVLSYFTPKESQAPRLVCRSWRLLTVLNWKNSNLSDLKEFVKLLVKQVKFTESIKTDLETLSFQTSALEVSEETVATPDQVDRAFWSDQGKILKIFNKLDTESRQNVVAALGHQIPHSLSDFFEFSDITLVNAVASANFRKFSIVFSRCAPLQEDEYANALAQAGKHGNLQMIHVLAETVEKPDKVDRHKIVAAMIAWQNQHQACVKSLLDENTRLIIALLALNEGNVMLFRFVRNLVTFTPDERENLVMAALKKNLVEEAKTLFFPFFNPFMEVIPFFVPDISDSEFTLYIMKTISIENFAALKSLLQWKTLLPLDQLRLLLYALNQNKLEAVRSLLNHAPVGSINLTMLAIAAIDENKIDFAKLFLAHGSVNILRIAIALIMTCTLSFRSRLTLGKLLIQHNLWQRFF